MSDQLVDAADSVIEEARQQGLTLSQAALARELRARGFGIANDRLRWLTTVTGLNNGQEPR